jgi:hypothetical protein
MKKFLDQFALTPMQRIDFEGFIFTQAEKMLPGYNGGMWRTKKLGNVSILLLPVDDKTITLNNYAFGGYMTTDHMTASATFSSVVANWYAGLRAEQGRASDAMLQAVADYSANLSQAAEKLKNPGEFYRFID